jgi:hypothetical protein
MDQSRFAQFGKAGRQHALGDARYGPGDLGKASRSLEQHRDDHAGPTLAKERKHRGESLVAADRFRLLATTQRPKLALCSPRRNLSANQGSVGGCYAEMSRVNR